MAIHERDSTMETSKNGDGGFKIGNFDEKKQILN